MADETNNCFDEDLFSVFESDATETKKKTSKKNKKADNKESSLATEDLLRTIAGSKRILEDDNDQGGGGEEQEPKKGEAVKKKKKKRKVDEDDDDDDDVVVKEGNVLDDINLDDYLPRIKVHTVETVEACTHEVAVPHDAEYVPLKQSQTKPAKEYSFILDPFQKEALLCLECNQSVLVSAHTSAGKTVVAEYAIAMSLRDKQRVIYTTPIKALSNQKYREMYEEFRDVGLMTGDVTINPTASCLIMTTEILRSMLYRGSEVMREVAWVIFDEIHYMRDKERGVVWEETIILLPDNVHYVFLSATIPNARQFAEWICYLHKQPCHVVYTDYRPVPLQHYIFPSGGDGLHLVVDEQGNFKEDNFNIAMSVLQNAGDGAKGDQKGRRGGVIGDSNCFKIVKMIMERNFAPVIVFSFSKKECEAYAMQMSKLDFNTSDEKNLVEEVFKNAMDVLSDEDKKLPQVEHVLPLLRRGIGIHHSGLLPILKETIEILFSEGLIKTLFATETFAMGLNMPARTVLFTNARKFDGKDFRWVSSGEYIQMSGRAGRRGLDDRGIVILMVDEKMSPAVGRDLVKGGADPINSAFHLTYNMVLNLLRVEEINPEYMLERSFCQFQNYANIPDLYAKVKRLQDEHKRIKIPRESEVSTYHTIKQQLQVLATEFQSFITKPQYLLPFLQPGRMVKIKIEDNDFGWGIVINFQKKNTPPSRGNPTEEVTHIVDVLLHLASGSGLPKLTSTIKPCPLGEKGEMQVVPVTLMIITQISSIRLYYPQDLRPLDNRMSVLKSIQEVQRRFPNGIPLLDPIEDMGIKEPGLKDVVKKIEAFEHRMYTHPLHKDPNVEKIFNQYEHKHKLLNEMKEAKKELKKAKSLLQMVDLKCRKRVLRRLGYSTAADVIELKGRVACEISSADELLITEMLFNNVFNDLSVQQMVALLSCFVFQEKANEMARLTDELSGPLRQMQDMARRIAKVSIEAKLEIQEDDYIESFRPHLMDVVHAWCNGATFAQICKMTDVFEGSIIRCMRRLEELLRQMCQAAKGIGNTELENKFSDGIKRIKRDIIFAASLYL